MTLCRRRPTILHLRRSLSPVVLLSIFLLILLPGLNLLCQEAAYRTTVREVIDGDTVVTESGLRIRLHGIDAPELAQPYGRAARAFLAKTVLGTDLVVVPLERDRYGRTVAWLRLEDGTAVEELLLLAGLAWWYEEYAAGATRLAEAEAVARREGRGLWSENHQVPPWTWRERRRGGDLPPGVRDRDCSDFPSRAAAQAFFEAAGGPEEDPHGLDSDGDGLACESLR